MRVAVSGASGLVGSALMPVSPPPDTRSGRVLSRPTVLPMPAFAARLVFGEMAQELFLSEQRAIPARLVAAGFRFRHPELENALRSILRR